ncbi:MAG: hypothetical protein EU529_07290 [Promethearchaeota archaeon]|nr:MAG: hypothetical protein EU529_07290 [Candidatus Lokiarchaeota archaeon]
MIFKIPYNNDSELLLYIWKVIDLPNISMNELVYKISFELFLLSPEEALEFLQRSIKSNSLEKDDNSNLQLPQNSYKKLKTWQLKRKEIILTKLNSSRKFDSLIDDFEAEKSSNFNTLLKSFLDKGTINRAATISNDAFKIDIFDFKKGLIKAHVAGSKEKSYNIEIDTKNKIIHHNCHDFETRRAINKKFCKHLARIFLLLKEESDCIKFLNDIAENINEWEFSS